MHVHLMDPAPSSRPLIPLVAFLIFGMNKVSTSALWLQSELSLVWFDLSHCCTGRDVRSAVLTEH